MRLLGISAFYHDSAAALVVDGRVVAAAQEERFTRKKFDDGFPRHAIEYCLAAAGARLRDIDYVVFYDKPFLKFERLVETYLAHAPRGFSSFRKAMPVWLGEKLFQRDALGEDLRRIDAGFDDAKLLFTEHHHSHVASAFYPSPFEEALVLTMDGVGEWCTTAAALGKGNRVDIVKEIHFPHSLGLLYSAFTYHAGFKVNSGEYKLMGLAPYGEPRFRNLIRDNLIDLKPDGSFRLDMSYFNYCTGLTMTNAIAARQLGATVMSHTSVTELIRDGSKAVGAVAKSQYSGESLEIRARAIVNATGVWQNAFDMDEHARRTRGGRDPSGGRGADAGALPMGTHFSVSR